MNYYSYSQELFLTFTVAQNCSILVFFPVYHRLSCVNIAWHSSISLLKKPGVIFICCNYFPRHQ